MALPRKLKNMNLFYNGENCQGQVGSFTRPTLGRKMESWRGGGMDGPVKVDLGMSDDGIQAEWTTGGLMESARRDFGNTSANGVMLRFAQAYQRDDTGDVTRVEIVLRGRHETIEPGDAKPGEDTEEKITTTCSYYKETIDGEVVVEIDLLNMVFMVNGTDMMAEQRQAIGL